MANMIAEERVRCELKGAYDAPGGLVGESVRRSLRAIVPVSAPFTLRQRPVVRVRARPSRMRSATTVRILLRDAERIVDDALERDVDTVANRLHHRHTRTGSVERRSSSCVLLPRAGWSSCGRACVPIMMTSEPVGVDYRDEVHATAVRSCDLDRGWGPDSRASSPRRRCRAATVPARRGPRRKACVALKRSRFSSRS
jgi:hypothetical protein